MLQQQSDHLERSVRFGTPDNPPGTLPNIVSFEVRTLIDCWNKYLCNPLASNSGRMLFASLHLDVNLLVPGQRKLRFRKFRRFHACVGII